ncbi:MAG: DUF2953 domain-containing protein [Candidatus Latescibacteria bacterium]|nr:DUF2953 domain-containing protein [Candidatus Latescibacterota bacterium]
MLLLILIGGSTLILLFILLPFFFSIDGKKDETGMTLHASFSVVAGAIGAAVYYRNLPRVDNLREVQGTSPQKRNVRLAVALFGINLFTFSPPQKKKKTKRKKPGKMKKKAESEQKQKRNLRELWSSVRRGKDLFQRFREPAFCFLRSLLRAFRVRSICGDLTFGTGDPAETGMIFGWVMALREALGPRFRLHARPDFVQERIEGTLALKALIKPYRVLWALLALGGRLLWDELRRRIALWRAKRREAWRTVQA